MLGNELFFKSQFNYCPLILICHKYENNRKIKRLHERSLWTIYNDKQSSFNELLEKDDSVSIYEQNLEVVGTEMYKIINSLSTPLMKNIFTWNRSDYILRQKSQFSGSWINTMYYGTESILNLGPKNGIWYQEI